MSKSSARTQPRADWSLRSRGRWSASTLAALALTAAAGIGHEMGVSWVWAFVTAAVAAVAIVVTHQDAAASAVAYRLTCWLASCGWVGWGLAFGVLDGITLGVLAVGALGAALWAPVLTRRPKPRTLKTDQVHGGKLARKHVALAADWAARIRRVARVRVIIEEIVDWPGAGGFSALVVQPRGSSSTGTLTTAAVGLAEDARLPLGCNVGFRPGPYRGALWMDVATVNRLADVIPHPGIRLGKSITDPSTIRWGEHRDGSTATIATRENTTVLAGQKRSGKSGTLHNTTADAGAADDCLVWHLDLNGGGISRAWLRPWLQGRTDRPAIDWAAPCPEEALLMAQALIDIAIDRKSAHSELKARANVQLLPVSRELPQILLILDEGKEVLGTKITDDVIRQIRRRLETLVDIGGNEACNAVLSVLRSISTALSTDILKQCANRATMRVFDQSEIDFLFGYRRGVTPQDATEQGSGFLTSAGGPVRVFKSYFMLPSDIETAAVQIAQHRPELDTDAIRAAGPAYETRLGRMRYLFSTVAERRHLTPPEPVELPYGGGILWYPAGNEPVDVDDQDRLPERRRPGTVSRRDHLRLLPSDGVTAGWDLPATRRPAPRPTPVPDERLPPLHAEHVREVTGGEPLPEILERALQVRWDQGRLHTERLARLLGMSDGELGALLGAIGVQPLPNAFERAGKRRRGYDRGHLEDAADAIRRGEIAVPPEVAAWTAA